MSRGTMVSGTGKYGLALLWAAALALACLHMFLFICGYRLTADDASFAETFMRGHAAIWESGSSDAHAHGRIGMFLLRPLNNIAAYLSGEYLGRLGFVALYYANFLLFSRFISRVLLANVTLLMFVILVVMHPVAFEHMPPNAYPLQNTLPFLLLLACRLLLMGLAGHGNDAWRTTCTIVLRSLFALAMAMSEYAILFGTALLLTEYSIQFVRYRGLGADSVQGLARIARQGAFKADGAVVFAVLAVYASFRWFNPSQYDGNSADGLLNVARMGMTTAGHIASGTVFGQFEVAPLHMGPAVVFATFVAGALAAACGYCLLPLASSNRLPWATLIVSVCAAVYVTLPVAMTNKQQDWCMDGKVCGFVDSRSSYFWVGLAVLCLFSLLLRKAVTPQRSKYLVLTISLALGLVSMITYVGNWRQAQRMDSISKAWVRADILACLPDRVPASDEGLKDLIDPRAQVIFHPGVRQQDYWRRYLELKSRFARCRSDERALEKAYSEHVAGIHPLAIGHKVEFSDYSGLQYLSGEWSPESWGAWSLGRHASFKFGLEEAEGKDLILSFRGLRHYVGAAAKPVTVEFNGQPVAVLRMNGSAQAYAVRIPAAVARRSVDGASRVTFVVPDPISPKQAGSGIDTRQLGVGLVDITILLAD